jgi:hypothetical protein
MNEKIVKKFIMIILFNRIQILYWLSEEEKKKFNASLESIFAR